VKPDPQQSSPTRPALPERAFSCALVSILFFVIGGLSESWLISGIGVVLFAPMGLFLIKTVSWVISGLFKTP
jgi:hypothetical protein